MIEHSYASAIEMREQLHHKLMEEFSAEMDNGHSTYYLSEMQYKRKWSSHPPPPPL